MRFQSLFQITVFSLVVIAQFVAISPAYAANEQWTKGNDLRIATNYPSIQAAIDSLPLSGGTVLIPSGTYIISVPIEVSSNIALIGEGFNTILRFSDEANTDVIRNKHLGAWVDENITIANMQIDGNGAKQNEPSSGIFFWTVRNARLENLWIHDFPIKFPVGVQVSASIHLEFSLEAVIKNNIIENNGYSGIFVGFSDYAEISRNSLIGNHRGIYLRNSDFAKVTKNVLLNNDEGIRIYYDGSYNRIIGNYIEGSSEEGITITHPECIGNFLVGNTLVNNTVQIDDQGTNTKIAHNKLIPKSS